MFRDVFPYPEGPTVPGWRTAASPAEIREIREFHRPFWEKDLEDARAKLAEALDKVKKTEAQQEERNAALDERAKAIVAREVRMRKLTGEYCSSYEKREASIAAREASVARQEKELSARAADLELLEASARERESSSSDEGKASYEQWLTRRNGELSQRVRELERRLAIAQEQAPPDARLITLQRWEALVAEREHVLKRYIQTVESLSRRAWSTRVCIQCLRTTETDKDFYWVAGKKCGHILCSLCTGETKTCPVCGQEHDEGFLRLH